MFKAVFTNGEIFSHPVTKVVCVGRNYAEHAKELNNPVPDQPILFIKPESSVVDLHQPLVIPESDCHYEAEIAVLIGSNLNHASIEEASSAVIGFGLALDLTRRELQSELKAKSHPWEIAKGFDGACPVSQFIPVAINAELSQIIFSMSIDGVVKQFGDSKDMLTPILPLLVYMSRYFTLKPGDIVLTGTPKGVGELKRQSALSFNLEFGSRKLNFDTTVS